MTFELFYSMELEFCRHIGAEGINSDTAEMMENENVLFCWCIISASWEEKCSSILLPMIIQLWITIRLDREVQISSKKDCTEIKESLKGTCKRLSIDPFWISFFLCFFLCFKICFYLYIWITEALEVVGSIVRVNWC